MFDTILDTLFKTGTPVIVLILFSIIIWLLKELHCKDNHITETMKAINENTVILTKLATLIEILMGRNKL